MNKPDFTIPSLQIDSVLQFLTAIIPAPLGYPRLLPDDSLTPRPVRQNEFKEHFVYNSHVTDEEDEVALRRHLFKVTLVHINSRIRA